MSALSLHMPHTTSIFNVLSVKCNWTIIINCSRCLNATENVENVCYKKGWSCWWLKTSAVFSIYILFFIIWAVSHVKKRRLFFHSFYIALQGIIKSNLIYNKGLDAFAHLVMIMEFLLLTLHMQTRPVFS